MHRSLYLASLALAAAPLGGCSWTFTHGGFPHKSQRESVRSTLHVPGSALEIRTHNGSIRVVVAAAQSDVSIEAHIVCRGKSPEEAEERQAATTLTVERRDNGTLYIEPVFPGGQRNGDGASISVRIPDADGVSLHTSNGSVTSKGLAGKAVIDTSNGSVTLTDHDGDAWIDTSNGPIVVSALSGSLVLDTSNGPVRLENVVGPVRADTSNGPIIVNLGPESVGPLHLDTSNGSVTVTVGAAFTGEVRLSTSNASISVRDHSGRVREQSLTRSNGHLVIGSGGEASVIDTSNGRITLTIEG